MVESFLLEYFTRLENVWKEIDFLKTRPRIIYNGIWFILTETMDMKTTRSRACYVPIGCREEAYRLPGNEIR